jgi:hypothetical protein
LAYNVHVSDADREYLDALPLSEVAKGKVKAFIRDTLAVVDDAFRNDPANRIQAGSPHFRLQLLLLDAWGDRKLHLIEFIVNDEHARFGVLVVVYVECK